ncbi:MAG: hypothetical protein QM813_00315 [Verrucomicrobiota bacterium]
MPLNRTTWEIKLNQLSATAKLEQKIMQVEASDFASSFRRGRPSETNDRDQPVAPDHADTTASAPRRRRQ